MLYKIRYSTDRLCLSSGPIFGHPTSNSRLSGVVADELGAKIASAYILIRPDTAGMMGVARTTFNLTSDRHGAFDHEVNPGFYNMCVMSIVFLPQCREVRVAAGKPIEMRFTLKMSPEVEKEIADDFPQD